MELDTPVMHKTPTEPWPKITVNGTEHTITIWRGDDEALTVHRDGVVFYAVDTRQMDTRMPVWHVFRVMLRVGPGNEPIYAEISTKDAGEATTIYKAFHEEYTRKAAPDPVLERIMTPAKIMINGRKFDWVAPDISYARLIELAYSGRTDPPGRIYTVTYGGRDKGDNGTLMPGGRVVVSDGMTFSVADTSNA